MNKFKLIVILLLLSFLTGCEDRPFLASATINSENVAELNDQVVAFLKSVGFKTIGKSKLDTPDGVSITENFQLGEMDVGLYYWTPKNILDFSFIPSSNTENLNIEEITLLNKYCDFMKKIVVKGTKVEVNVRAERCEDFNGNLN